MCLPNEGNVREEHLGSGANGSAAPETSLGWRQSVQGSAVGSARALGPATSALALTCLRPAGHLESHRGAGGGASVEQELSLLPVGGGAFRVLFPDVQATWAPQLRKGPEPDRPGLRGHCPCSGADFLGQRSYRWPRAQAWDTKGVAVTVIANPSLLHP